MPASMKIRVQNGSVSETYEAQLEFDAGHDYFCGLVEITQGMAFSPFGPISKGWIAFHGENPSELRASFRDALTEHATECVA